MVYSFTLFYHDILPYSLLPVSVVIYTILSLTALLALSDQVKVLYARNLTQECTEDKLRDTFEQFGAIERVKKIKDYAFIHFVERAEAVKVCKYV